MATLHRSRSRGALAVLVLFPALLAGQSRPTVSVGGTGYLNYRYQLETDSSLTPMAHGNNFDVDRTYITVKAKFDRGLSARITTDVDGRRAAANQLTFRLKYGYLGWNPAGSPLSFKLGMINTPVIGYIEELWGYRMQGSVALDRAGYLTSSDFGVSVDGGWADDAVNLTAGIYNGEGYSGAPGDQHKDVAARVSVRLMGTDHGGPTGGLRLTGFALVGKANGGGDRKRFLGLVSYQSRRLTLGLEYAVARDSTASDAPQTAGRVMSAFGRLRLPDSPLEVMARVDRHDPDRDTDPAGPDPATGERTRVIAGMSYQMTPQVRFLVDADLLSLEHGSPGNAFNASRRTLYFHTEFTF
jgi:hypothetical protein